MPCELYKDALIEAAVTSAAPQDALRLHLDNCAHCRASFAEQQSLFAAIDGRLRLLANAEVPRHFLTSTRNQLAGEHTPQSRWMFGAVPVSILTAAVTVLALGFSIPGHKKIADHASVDKVSSVPDQRTIAVAPAMPVVKITENRPSSGQYVKDAPAQLAPSDEPQVLVPPEEREAFARFLEDLNAEQGVAAALGRPLAARPEDKEQPVQLPDLEIAQLLVPPLEQQDERQDEK